MGTYVRIKVENNDRLDCISLRFIYRLEYYKRIQYTNESDWSYSDCRWKFEINI